MNCNVAWYSIPGSCAPIWVQIIFFLSLIAIAIVLFVAWLYWQKMTRRK